MMQFLKDSIQQFYPVKVELAPSKKFPAHTFYKPRNRYRADSTIAWLHTSKPSHCKTVVAVTNCDVSVTKSGQVDFGVMGLGYKPGDACIISTYRLKKTAKSPQHLRERLFKVAVHEMGHNFSLSHCPDQQCIMVDAETKMKLDGVKGLCTSCKQKLQL
ncbi:MAG: zinc-dependent metalloprotease family protein [Lacibacter sp.]